MLLLGCIKKIFVPLQPEIRICQPLPSNVRGHLDRRDNKEEERGSIEQQRDHIFGTPYYIYRHEQFRVFEDRPEESGHRCDEH